MDTNSLALNKATAKGTMHTVIPGKPINRKVEHVHKLERKHSSGDLHSRLKTRKLLGVGETDDGDVHRSKLSQILGHSEQLYIKLPRGLRIWQFIIAFTFTVMALWALIFPLSLFNFALKDNPDSQVILPIRLFGGALIGLSVVFWHTLYSLDKDIIRWSLMGSSAYFVIQTLAIVVSLFEVGTSLTVAIQYIVLSVIYGAVSHYYFCAVSEKPTYKMRPNSSKPDINKSD